MKERFLYRIFPIKRKIIPSDDGGFKLDVVGFWGFVLKLFKINTFGKVYRYYGSYWSGIKSQYRFNKKQHLPFDITVKADPNWETYNYLKSWMEKGK